MAKVRSRQTPVLVWSAQVLSVTSCVEFMRAAIQRQIYPGRCEKGQIHGVMDYGETVYKLFRHTDVYVKEIMIVIWRIHCDLVWYCTLEE